ncbi:LacI family DNA-binding transcriptional regulator [Trueperella bialowiezensis]|uniref:Catabolite control protein n=1 Tax=Trueperella bialowiezensis TaxID=312285 RepID=A0A3S4WFH0_9ACTO|nr:LacI family DNA-binding transcriptional regulator [Trueperella bialowiezensis]VEI12720.1 Catabolite control protein [Trueperella bialowiezensis]
MNTGRRVTIYDVARRAGVSPSTVSRSLSRPGRVSAATLKIVYEAIEELGYAAGPTVAQSEAKTRTIAFSVQRLSNPIYEDILSGFRDNFPDSYVPVVLDAGENAEREAANIIQILPHVDGLIMSSSLLTESQIANIHKQKPTVLVQRRINGIPSVMFDMVPGVGQLMDLFAAHGHEDLLYVSGPEESWTSGIRWRALQTEANKRDLRISRSAPFEPNVVSGFEAVRAWQGTKATGIVAFNDIQAAGLLHGLRRAGVRVPDDVSVASFDNTIAAVVAQVPLTSIGGSNYDVGRHAAELLRDHLRRRNDDVPEIVLPMKTHVRMSVGKAPNN